MTNERTERQESPITPFENNEHKSRDRDKKTPSSSRAPNGGTASTNAESCEQADAEGFEPVAGSF